MIFTRVTNFYVDLDALSFRVVSSSQKVNVNIIQKIKTLHSSFCKPRFRMLFCKISHFKLFFIKLDQHKSWTTFNFVVFFSFK
jgi:hypothetical protein